MSTLATNPSAAKQAAVIEKEKAPTTDFERLLLQDTKTELRYMPFGGDEEIRLSVPLIKKFVAVPYFKRDGEKAAVRIEPSDEECIKFLMLCRARKLNPWEGDAYMVPFFDRDTQWPKWSLVTAHQCFLKRAQVNKDYDGMESGVIVIDEAKQVQYREGDFEFPGDTLVGGWAIVYTKNQTHPAKSRMKLVTYKQNFGRWMKDPAGMIVKVAEADALRRTFPTMLGGMMVEEEVEMTPTSSKPSSAKQPAAFTGPGGAKAFADTPNRVNTVKTPPNGDKTPQDEPESEPPQSQGEPGNVAGAQSGAQGHPAESKTQTLPPKEAEKPPTGRQNRPTMVEEPPQEPAEWEKAAASAPAQDKGEFVPNPEENEALQNVRFLCWQHDVTEAQLVKWAKAPQNKLLKEGQNEIADMSSQKLVNLGKLWQSDPATFKQNIAAAQ